MDVIIDLGEETSVSTIILHVFDQPASWIYLPASVEVSYSPDLKSGNAGSITKNIDPVKEAGSRSITIESKQTCRYVHIIAKNMGTIPNGNSGSGHPAWLFVDEIEIK